MVLNPGIGFILMTVLTLTTGTAFIMWLGEQITDRGIGNGMSLLIFTGIIAGLPRGVVELYQKVQTNQWGSFTIVAMLLLVVGMVAVVAFIVFVERSERRIPIQSARRIVGRRMMGGQSSHLPLKVNSGGVMPVIFASFHPLGADAAPARRSLCRTAASCSPSSRRSRPAIRGMSCSTCWPSSSSPTSISRS